MAVLMLKVKAMEVKIAEKVEKRKNYWAMILVKIVALKKGNNIQAILGYIESGLKLDTH